MPPLVLASSSTYRRELLSRLHLPFEALSPHLDESPLPGEAPLVTCERLAQEKARKIAQIHPQALIIGSDQIALLHGKLVGKPGNHANAVRQLQQASGQEMTFHTALCLLNAETGRLQLDRVVVTVQYRILHLDQIERYLATDQPYDCAGSGRIETLGITLVKWVKSDDPTALIGLPLISLTSMLQNEGVTLP
ncbi:MAG: Maf family nucleotide pyrophosphatase [Burkholderiales bacterium]|nr:septum formation protein Maf [Ferrovum sp.]